MYVETITQLDEILTASLSGSVVETIGMVASVADFPAPVGASVRIECQACDDIWGEVVGFRGSLTLVHLLASAAGVRKGDRARLHRTTSTLRVGPQLLGRIIDYRGQCIDRRPEPYLPDRVRRDQKPLPPVDRPRIRQALPTGVKAIDALLTCGRGQRLGIFAGSGVGKSVLLGMMSRYTAADVIVTGLIGERAREVNDFVERDLGPEGLARSVIVVATSNEPPLARLHAAATATAIAEYFRDQGKHVLLLLDSVTRFAMAQREIGLSAGEPPTTRGYPPSTYAVLPRLVERAGQSALGSITAFYTVLVDGDDENEPIADAVRGLLDGHVWLSRKLAGRGHYPAIDVLASISRLMNDIVPSSHREAALTVRRLLSVYAENEDLLSIGAYRRGSNRTLDTAVEMREAIDGLLQQHVDETMPFDALLETLGGLAARCHETLTPAEPAPHVVEQTH